MDETLATPALAQADVLLDLLDTLVPPEDTVIRDVEGREYRIPRAISTRRQVALLRVVREAIGSSGVVDALRGGSAGLLDLLTADDTLALFDRAVLTALPDLIREARNSIGVSDASPCDLFPAEELLSAILPFCGQASRRIRGLRR